MCRLFGFCSETFGSMDRPFMVAENALCKQSEEHKDGWGVAYYHHGVPHVLKGRTRAAEDQDFRRLGQHLKANTVIAHLRRATQGDISLVNCHPFQYGNWVMAHNGDLPDFTKVRDELIVGIHDDFLAHVFGSTDSEIYFALFLNELNNMGILHESKPPINKCALALRNVVKHIEQIYRTKPLAKPFALNVLISNGNLLMAYRNGHELSFNVDAEKTHTSKRDGDKISRLIISSEPLNKEDVFENLNEGQIVALDHEFRLFLTL